MTAYDEYIERIKHEFLGDKHWAEIKKKIEAGGKSKYTLIIGAGVTACIVGSWNQLLNEVAIHRVVDDNNGSCTPKELCDYVGRVLNGALLPNATDVLEKGEYLQFDPADSIDASDRSDRQVNQRERNFAHRVLSSIRRLEKRQLKGRNYEEDFLDWLSDHEISAFRIRRKQMSDMEHIRNALTGKSLLDLINGLNEWQKDCAEQDLDIDIIRKEILASNVAYLKCLLPMENPDVTIRKAIQTAEAGNIEEALKKLIIEAAAYALWLPNYCTLDALLYLSLHGKFQSVLTYNFDTVFDRLLANEEVQDIYGVPDTKVRVYGIHSVNPYILGKGKRAIDVHHVHGILDEDIEKVQSIIFSGTSYEEYQSNHFNLGSMKIASAWYSGSLLCVGFSGSDANFRSILREFIHMKGSITSLEDEEMHDVYITRGLKTDREVYGLTEKTNDDDLMFSYACLKTYMSMLQNYFFNKTGAHIIWDEDFESMARNLKGLIGP